MKRATAAACLALALAACGASAPRLRPAGAGARVAPATQADDGPVMQAERTHEYPSPRPKQTTTAGAPTPVAAIDAFATAYINWSYATVAADLRTLAAASVGQARSAMSLAAAQAAGDYELQRGGVSNHGTVEAVAPLGGRRNQFVVVTRELTTATATDSYQGLRPAWHITVATATEVPDGRWAVSAWQPKS